MNVYVFSESGTLTSLEVNESDVVDTCHTVVSNMKTTHLVVAVYITHTLFPEWHATSWAECLTPEEFRKNKERNKWGCVNRFPVPDHLPERYWLIRIHFGVPHENRGGLAGIDDLSYPCTWPDGFGWRFEIFDFLAHLGLLMSHQLYLLQTAPFDEERYPFQRGFGADEWALQKTRDAGFSIQGEPNRPQMCTPGKREAPSDLPENISQPEKVAEVQKAASALSLPDLQKVRDWLERREAEFLAMPSRQCMDVHMRRMRCLTRSDWVRIRFDPDADYEEEVALVLESPASDATHMEIRTADGKVWKWPMTYLEPCGEEDGWGVRSSLFPYF